MNCANEGGVNDCHWNMNGKCTSFEVTKSKDTNWTRDWNSKQNCTLTQVGVHMCSSYMPEGTVDYAGQLVKTYTKGFVSGEKRGRLKLLQELIEHYEKVVKEGEGVTYNHAVTYSWMYNGIVIDYLKGLRDKVITP
jgi:hypothetical protein